MSEVHDNWERLFDIVEKHVGEGYEGYRLLLENLKSDHHEPDGTIILGFMRAPAAKRNHHALEGGLVKHYLEMWDAWEVMRDSGIWKVVPGHLDNDRIIKAIINHDIHKAYFTFELESDCPWQTTYTNHYNEKAMTWGGKCIWILGQNGVELDALQMNALQHSEGGWAESPPKWGSVLAKAAYLLDEISGNVMSRIEDGTLLNVGVK